MVKVTVGSDKESKVSHVEKECQSRQPNKFRLPVAIATNAKMRAVANYKKGLKAKQPVQATVPTINDTTKGKDVLSAETLKEIENLLGENSDIQHEMIVLEKIRMSLLWLLHKSTLLETARNHSHT